MPTAPARTTPLKHRLATLACWHGAGLALLLTTAGVLAQPATRPAAKQATKPQATTAKTSKVAKPASDRQKLKNEATGLALASETAETIDELQLAIAARVLTGSVDCDFNQRISVVPLAGKSGFFTITHFTAPYKSQRYTMAPRETATGAVRLEDKAAGVVWLQIPTKSMLMNARAGQRMVDSCLHAEQRIAVAAAAAAGPAQGEGIGIVAQLQAPAVVPVQMPAEVPVQMPAEVPVQVPALPALAAPAVAAPDLVAADLVAPAMALPAPPIPPIPPAPAAAAIDSTAVLALPPATTH